MCQLNVYLFDKSIPEIRIKQIFNQNHYNAFENINEEVQSKNFNLFNSYDCAGMRCDCGSVVCLLQDYKGKYNTYAQYMESVGKDKIARLYKIKEFLLTLDAGLKQAQTIFNRDKMFAKITAFRKPIMQLELELNEASNKLTSGEEDVLLIETLKNKLSDAYSALENSEEYRMLNLAYEDYIKRNELIIDSRNYTLENTDKAFPANIDLAIIKAEKDNHIKTNLEFTTLKKIYSEILEYTNEIKLFAFWQDDDYSENGYFDEVKEVKRVSIKDLKLEDLIFLKYRELITITN